MNFKNFRVTLEADGFRITARAEGIAPGTPFLAEYELVAGEWRFAELYFDPEPPSLFHPFRRSMFVYTGVTPIRVVLRARSVVGCDPAFMGRIRIQEVRQLYSDGCFECAPDFTDAVWETGVPPSWAQPLPSSGSHEERGRSWDLPPPLPGDPWGQECEVEEGRGTQGEQLDVAWDDASKPVESAGVEPNAY
ncbi:MAG: hypothetical protein RLZZ399_689 [Verrucomicrobiota bacterium]|jgi:hypothetical protein